MRAAAQQMLWLLTEKSVLERVHRSRLDWRALTQQRRHSMGSIREEIPEAPGDERSRGFGNLQLSSQKSRR